MPKSYKILGQAAPGAASLTPLYTVPATKSAVASTLTICNRDPNNTAAVRVAVIPSGQTIANQYYLQYDELYDLREAKNKVLGFSLAAGDSVQVYSDTGSVSFTLFGVENSPN